MQKTITSLVNNIFHLCFFSNMSRLHFSNTIWDPKVFITRLLLLSGCRHCSTRVSRRMLYSENKTWTRCFDILTSLNVTDTVCDMCSFNTCYNHCNNACWPDNDMFVNTNYIFMILSEPKWLSTFVMAHVIR